MQKKQYLIHANVAIGKAPLDSNIMSGFVQNIEKINTVGSESHGFISLPTLDDAGEIYVGDSLVNVSIWESIEDLKKFTYTGMHAEILKKRRSWFKEQSIPNYVLFWFDAAVKPKEADVKERIEYLAKFGPTPYAFNFRNGFTMDEAEVYQTGNEGL